MKADRNPKPTTTLKIGVTLAGKGNQPGPVAHRREKKRLESEELTPTDRTVKRAIEHMEEAGFKLTARGKVSLSFRGSKSKFESVFGTELTRFEIEGQGHPVDRPEAFYFPAPGAPWEGNEQLDPVIDDAYIQWPYVYLNQRFDRAQPSPIPPNIDYHHLRVPSGVAMTLNAHRAHRRGITGQGVRVAMIDSGFAHSHPYFVEHGYNTQTVLAAGANRVDEDGNGHGTGESANLLAVAPNVEFTGVKLDNETTGGGASLLEGFQEALQHDPQVISVSLGFDLRSPTTGLPLQSLPNSLIALEAEIQAAVADGIVVVFSAGNGHIAFPGMMPEVLSAGGVFVDSFGQMEASDYASAFRSRVYTNRDVPDCSGLVGRAANGASYILLPIPPNCAIDVGSAMVDGTWPNDGWGVFSGTSAAAPQLAGACALLLEENPGLTPAQVRNALVQSARAVDLGAANGVSNPGGQPLRGADATGGGLVDVDAALQLV